MSKLQEAIVGLDVFCSYLRSTGRRARVIESAPGLEQGFFSRDQKVIGLKESPIDLVVLRFGGFVSPRQTLGAGGFDINVGGVPILARQVLPIQYHYIVRTELAYPMLDTRLEQKTRGLLKRERIGLGWSGKFVGPKLEADDTIMTALRAHIGLDDKLVIEADPKNKLVRIKHHRACVVDLNVFASEPIRFHREHAAPPLLDAFDRIAGILRAPMQT